MGMISFQITSLAIVYSTVYSGADQRKHQISAPLAFEWGIHRGPVNSPYKWPVTRKMFPFDHGVESIRGFALIIISYFRVASLPQCHEVYGHNWPATKIVQNVKWMHTYGNTCYLCAMLCGALTECGTCTRCNLQRNDFLPKINMAKEENIRIKADRLKKYQ